MLGTHTTCPRSKARGEVGGLDRRCRCLQLGSDALSLAHRQTADSRQQPFGDPESRSRPSSRVRRACSTRICRLIWRPSPFSVWKKIAPPAMSPRRLWRRIWSDSCQGAGGGARRRGCFTGCAAAQALATGGGGDGNADPLILSSAGSARPTRKPRRASCWPDAFAGVGQGHRSDGPLLGAGAASRYAR